MLLIFDKSECSKRAKTEWVEARSCWDASLPTPVSIKMLIPGLARALGTHSGHYETERDTDWTLDIDHGMGGNYPLISAAAPPICRENMSVFPLWGNMTKNGLVLSNSFSAAPLHTVTARTNIGEWSRVGWGHGDLELSTNLCKV